MRSSSTASRLVAIATAAAAVTAGPAATPQAERPAQKPGVVFSTYRATSIVNGSLYIYIRNAGTAGIGLESISLNGRDIDGLKADGVETWHTLRPRLIPPGKLGELLIRFESLPAEWVVGFFTGTKESVEARVTVRLTGAEPIETSVRLSEAHEPVQINFVGFSADLRTLHLYAQNNDWLLGDHGNAHRVKAVGVNGEDVTARCRFGNRTLTDTVVPIEVSLPAPLAKGRYTVVTLETEDGYRTGLTVRALPSEFPIQVVLFQELRADGVADVYEHGFTAVGQCGWRDQSLREAKPLGLDLFLFDSEKNLECLHRYSGPAYPEIKGYWMDEIDRYPEKCFEAIRRAEVHYEERGRHMPLHTLNIMAASKPRGADWFEFADAVTQGYCLEGVGGPRSDFACHAALAKREYRRARRPFLPYLRNAEVGFELDVTNRTVIGLSPIRPYPIMPAEERFLTYGCLMQGAKGFLHWGYGHMLFENRWGWFSHTYPSLRLSMGGLPGDMARGYTIPRDVVEDLKAVWGEIGRINVELRTIGPLVALSDVSNLARIERTIPEKGVGKWGDRTAEVASLVCGLDTVIVLLLNMDLQTGWSAARQRDNRIVRYEPVDVTLRVRVPPWLKPVDTFTVDVQRLADARPLSVESGLTFRFPRLAVSQILVVTADQGLRARMARRLADGQARLRAAARRQPQPLPACYEDPDAKKEKTP
ncbi:MAG: hypothetical protein JXR37_05770 [Kiritimatiellae bacterium]|nr:hypothetical protein [Kiritimatiellia bacterium]